MSELTSMSASQVIRLLDKREVALTEVVEAYLRRIEALNPAINAITDLQADRAREQARLAEEERRQEWEGGLQGIPITIKSSIAVEGFRHECGTPLRQGEIAKEDATLVAEVKRTGVIILGTTNVPEFLMAYETDNALYGRTNSPLNPDYTPGGSSGGDAAAVAAGFSAASFGSDAGGSIRVPAHFCGLYGFKATPGELSRTGHWPPVAGPSTLLAGVGPLARSAEDLERFYWAARGFIEKGFDASDASSIRREPEPYLGASGAFDLLSIGWFDHAWDTPVTAETRAAVRTAVAALKDRKFRVERVELQGLEQAPRTWRTLFGTCLKTLIKRSTPSDYRLHALAYDAMASDEEEAQTSYEDLLQTWVAQDQLRCRFREQLEKPQFLLCPVAAIPAFKHGERSWSIDGQTVGYPDAFVYSQVFNLLGAPAATVPVSKTADGRPIGVQVVGRPNTDEYVLQLARALSDALQGT